MADEYTGYLRIFQANNSLKPCKLYINDKLIDSSFTYKEFTEYMECLTGCYNIILKDAKDVELYATSVVINDNNVSTLVIYGTDKVIKSALLVDSSTDNYKSKLPTIRYANFVNDRVTFDIYVNDKKVVSELAPEQVSYYMHERVGENRFVAKSSKTDKTLLQVPKMLLKTEYVYTAYMVGDVDAKLELVIPLEGVTYIKPN